MMPLQLGNWAADDVEFLAQNAKFAPKNKPQTTANIEFAATLFP